MSGKENYADDFLNALDKHNDPKQGQRDLPALHPKDVKEKFVDLSKEEGPLAPKTPNLLELPKKKLHGHYRRFNLSFPADVEALEAITNKCLSETGWILAREEWDSTKNGDRIVTIKFMSPHDAEVPKREDFEEDDPEEGPSAEDPSSDDN